MDVEVGQTISIRNAFSSKSSPQGFFDRITGMATEVDGESLLLSVKQFGHRDIRWSPEDGGYLESELVTQAVSILASRGIQVPQSAADWVLVWYETDDLSITPQSVAFDILVYLHLKQGE